MEIGNCCDFFHSRIAIARFADRYASAVAKDAKESTKGLSLDERIEEDGPHGDDVNGRIPDRPNVCGRASNKIDSIRNAKVACQRPTDM